MLSRNVWSIATNVNLLTTDFTLHFMPMPMPCLAVPLHSNERAHTHTISICIYRFGGIPESHCFILVRSLNNNDLKFYAYTFVIYLIYTAQSLLDFIRQAIESEQRKRRISKISGKFGKGCVN